VSTLAVNAVTDANGGNTATINSMTPTADSLQGFRNRIINGDCRIAQRGTAAVTASSSFPVDRFFYNKNGEGEASLQQDSSAPVGFVNSLKYTVTTADGTLTTTQRSLVIQHIEGTNVSDLAWGTANAKTVTLSFWVRSSLTGTFGGSLQNSAQDRSYPFTYTIYVADTWEYKTVTITGDTTGTWLTTTGIGIRLFFSLGVGPSLTGTAGSWAGADYRGATGETAVIGTLNATWYVTGVQLEVGSVATPFERRPYGTEFDLCRRYYEQFSPIDTFIGNFAAYSTTTSYGGINYYPKRATPSFTAVGGASTYTMFGNNASQALAGSALFFQHASTKIARVGVTATYTQGYAYFLQFASSGTAYIEISSEL
jgi:hypothetical protein